MSHILIQNKGELPLWGMRLMGLSDKDESQIGRFGTGLKESIALLSRMGLIDKFAIFSGTLRIGFSVQEMDGQQEICFTLSEDRGRFTAGTWHGLSIHPNLGKADWDDPWMLFREIICNALDEGGKDDLYHDVISTEPEGKPGATRVYVPVTLEILEAYSTIYRKLLPLGKYEVAHSVVGYGKAIKKRSESNLQIFHRGVWIQEKMKNESLFDYEIDNIKLNESRSADWYGVNNSVGVLVANYNVEQAKELLVAVLMERKDIFEREMLQHASYYVDSKQTTWSNAFYTLYGENAVITDDSKFYYEQLSRLGKNPVIVTHSGLSALLKAAGVPTAASVLTREQQEWEETGEPTTETRTLFDKVWSLFERAELTRGVEKPNLKMFRERPGKSEVCFGAYYSGVCYVNEACVGSEHERWACIEEIAHHISRANDRSEELQHFLVECLDTFIFGRKEIIKN